MSETQAGLQLLADRILDLNPVSVLDVRAGSGDLGTLLRSLQPALSLTAIESDARQYRLHEVYNQVLVVRSQELPAEWWPDVDVAVLHEPTEGTDEARALWGLARDSARRAAFLTLPLAHYAAQWVMRWFFGISESWVDEESGLGYYGWYRDAS